MILCNLAELYRTQGHYLKKIHGPEHPDVATSLNNLADLYCDQSRYAEAEPLYLRALAIREKVFGPDHSLVKTMRDNLQVVRRAMGKIPSTDVG